MSAPRGCVVSTARIEAEAAERAKRAARDLEIFRREHGGRSPTEEAAYRATLVERVANDNWEAHANGAVVSAFYSDLSAYPGGSSPRYTWTCNLYGGATDLSGEVTSAYEVFPDRSHHAIPADSPEVSASVRAALRRIAEFANQHRAREAESRRRQAERDAERAEADRRFRLSPLDRHIEDSTAAMVALTARVAELEQAVATLSGRVPVRTPASVERKS